MWPLSFCLLCLSLDWYDRIKRSTVPSSGLDRTKEHRRRRESHLHDQDFIEPPYNVSIVLTSWFPPAIRVSWNFDALNGSTSFEIKASTVSKESMETSLLPVKGYEGETRHNVVSEASGSSSTHPLPSKSLLKMFQIKYNPIGSRSVTYIHCN